MSKVQTAPSNPARPPPCSWPHPCTPGSPHPAWSGQRHHQQSGQGWLQADTDRQTDTVLLLLRLCDLLGSCSSWQENHQTSSCCCSNSGGACFAPARACPSPHTRLLLTLPSEKHSLRCVLISGCAAFGRVCCLVHPYPCSIKLFTRTVTQHILPVSYPAVSVLNCCLPCVNAHPLHSVSCCVAA